MLTILVCSRYAREQHEIRGGVVPTASKKPLRRRAHRPPNYPC